MSQSESWQTGAALYDRADWGRLLVSGADRLRFLHNQTTNAFIGRQPGEGCETVFVTATGRTLDLVSAYVLEEAVLLLVSPGCGELLLQWMDRFIFFADKVTLQDITATTTTLSLLGPDSDRLMTSLGAAALVGQPPGRHQTVLLPEAAGGSEVRVAVSRELGLPGYTLFTESESATALQTWLQQQGATLHRAADWEQLRIRQGRPAPGHELTEDYNPLEAGLWHTISLSKGCYIGQETIARLHTYRGVKQQLWGVTLSAAVPLGAPLISGDDKIGVLTSLTQTAEGWFGLAYVRTRAIEAGVQQATVEGAIAQLRPLPYVSHKYL